MKQKTLFKMVVSGSGTFVAALVSVGRLRRAIHPATPLNFQRPASHSRGVAATDVE
jgi:hypothetical protein